MRKLLLSILALGMIFGLGRVCPAAEPLKPIAVVSIAAYGDLMKSIEQVTALAGKPDAYKAVDGMLKAFTQGQGLAGLDEKRPAGLVVLLGEGDVPVVYGFVPVSDLKKLLGVVQPMLGATMTSSGPGTYTLEKKEENKKLIVKEKGGWAFVADKPELLENLPDDPSKLLGDLNKQYVVAAQFLAASVPHELIEKKLAAFLEGMNLGAVQKADEDAAAYAARTRFVETAKKSLADLANDLEQITLGLAVDSSAKKVRLDFSATFKPGSKMAQKIESQSAGVKTELAGFLLPGAALTVHMTQKADAEDIEATLAMIQGGRAKATKEIAEHIESVLAMIRGGSPKVDTEKPAAADDRAKKLQQLVGDLIDVCEATVKDGRYDAAVSMLLDPKAATLSAGARISAGDKLEKSLRALIELTAKDEPSIREHLKLDADTVGDVHFHTVSIPLPAGLDGRDRLVSLVGESVDVVVGVGPSRIYLAAGRNALSTLKVAVKKSEAVGAKATDPFHLSVAATPIIKTVAELNKEEPMAQMITGAMLDALSKCPGNDHITLASRYISRGVKAGYEIEEGVLKLIGVTSGIGATMMGGGQPPAANPPAGL